MEKKKKPLNLIIFLLIILLSAQILGDLLFVFFVKINAVSIALFCLIQVCFIIGYIFVFLTNRKVANLNKKIGENKNLDEQRQFDLQYYELIKSHRQEIATMRHEIANGLQVAMSLLKSQSIEDKKKGAALLYDIGLQNSVTNDVIYCNNPIINTIIAVKAKIAKGLSIKTKIEVSAADNISVSKLDLCSIFGNLFDNAIDAAKLAKDKYIELKAGELSGFFVIKIKNSKVNDISKVNNEIITTKDDAEDMHGKGLKMLRRVAEKYGGKLNIEYDEESFTVVMTLQLRN